MGFVFDEATVPSVLLSPAEDGRAIFERGGLVIWFDPVRELRSNCPEWQGSAPVRVHCPTARDQLDDAETKVWFESLRRADDQRQSFQKLVRF